MNRLDIATALAAGMRASEVGDKFYRRDDLVQIALEDADALIQLDRETRCKACKGQGETFTMGACKKCNGTGVDWGHNEATKT